MNVVVTITKFFFGLFFGIKYGIYGFLISNLIVSIFSAVFIYGLYQRELKLIWPLKKILLLYLFIFVACVAIIVFRIIDLEYGFRLLFKIILLFSIIKVLLKLKIFSKQDFLEIFNKIKMYLVKK